MRKRGSADFSRGERERRSSDFSAPTSQNRPSLLRRALQGALAVVLAAGLLPVLPAAVGTDRAEALEGTTNYKDFFTPKRISGEYGYVQGSTLYASSTANSTYYAYGDRGWVSSSGFVSNRPIALTHDWEIKVSAAIDPIAHIAATESVRSRVGLGFSDNADPGKITGITMTISRVWTADGGGDENISAGARENGLAVSLATGSMVATMAVTNPAAVTLSYSAANDRLTLSYGARSVYYTGVKTYMKASNYYLALVGETLWRNKTKPTVAQVPATSLGTKVTFNSMSLPHLTPTISDIKIYRTNGTLIGPNDSVSNNEIVKVACVVKNTNSGAVNGSFKERYPMHLKLLNTATYPTQGFTPFVDSPYPVQVNGATVTASANGNTVNGTYGVPVTLVGNDAATITYYARVTQANGAKVSLGQQLVEDSFGGSHQNGVTLISEKALKPLPDNGSGTAGKDYHYSRSPQANANGWNTSPVTLTFFPGDFDQLSLTPGGGAASTLTGAAAEWVRRDDTSGLTVALKATNSSTGAASTAGSESIKIDTAKPSLSVDPALGVLTINDKSADASKATSGVWRLYRTGADGTIAARAAAKTFPLTNGVGAATQTVSNPTNGYYVAEDAAGNVSDVFKVGATEPPTVSRPAGSIVDPSDPNPPTPVGPPIGPGDAVPTPTVSEDDIGLKHAVINETITQFVDAANPAFGGSLTLDGAKALMAYRYEATPSAAPATTTVELLDTLGAPLASLPTTAVGECLIRQVTTDAQGNTTTINLTYRLIKDNCPVVRPWQPADPDDPTGPKVPGEALESDGPVTTKPDGTQHATVSCEATEVVRKGTMGADGAAGLLKRHFALASFDGKDAAVRTVSLATAAGAAVDSIDLSAPGDYLITYEATDADGNSTTVKLTYHLVPSRAPGTTAHPDPGTNPNPQPGDDPLNPKPYPLEPTDPPRIDADGTHHATVRDEMVVPVQEGVSLSLTDVRDLMGRRYAFAPVAGGSTTERALEIARADGSAADSIDLSQPGEYVIRYEVADEEGNSTTVLLTYRVQATEPTPPEEPDDPSGPDEPTPPEEPETPVPPTVVVKPGEGADGPGGGLPDTKPRPLPPTSVTVDPETGLSHAVIRDTLTVGTSGTPATAESLAALFAKRYEITSSQPDGELTRGAVALFDAAGGPVEAIDRSQPGDWRADQVVADSAGNTTTIHVTYLVREGSVGGGVTDDGNGAGSGAGPGDGSGGDGAGSDDGDGRWASLLTRLPQTGDLLTRCPVHIMFVLLMVLASAYGLARLRQEAARERDRRQRALEELWDAELQRPGGGMWS